MPARAVLQMEEGRLALRAHAHDAPGDGDGRPIVAHGVVVGGQHLGGGVAPLVPVGEGRYALGLERRALLAAGGLDERAVVVALAPVGAHAALPPKRLRYAWMKASRSPSMTRWTSPTLTSVRWSLTIVYGWKT